MQRNLIGIYKDAGATWHLMEKSLAPYAAYGLTTALVSRADVMEHDALNPSTTPYAAFILLGSDRGQSYRDDFKEEGYQIIRTYCAAGGLVVGICAGSSILVEWTDWRDPNLTRRTNDSAALIKGELHGPLPQLLRQDAPCVGWFKANVARVCLPSQPAPVPLTYWGGGHYVAREEVDVLARFADVIGNDGLPVIAAARKKYGAGDVVVSAVHPEVSAELLIKNVGQSEMDADYLVGEQKGAHRTGMIEQLATSEIERQLFLHSLLRPILDRRRARIRRYG